MDILKNLKFQIDSKQIKKGEVFIAIDGKKVSGISFLKEVSQVTKLAIVPKAYKGPSFGMHLIKVKNVVEFIQELAKEKVMGYVGKKIAITGSCGKTTTKEFTKEILKGGFSVYANERSYNSQITMPMSILNMEKSDVLLVEMGMSQKNEMQRLSDILEADIGLVTNVGYVHIGNFKNIEEVIREKLKIFKKNTKKIINYDLLPYVKEGITFSIENRRADYFLEKIGDKIRINNSFFPRFLEEKHLLEDFLASYVIAKELKITDEQIKDRIKYIKTPPLRFEKVMKDGILYIKDFYNSNPHSLKAALESLPQANRKIAVLGEMRELGKLSKKLHREIGEFAIDKIDVLICYGSLSYPMYEAFKEKKEAYFFKDPIELLNQLDKLKKDLVLIKGSRALEMEKIFNL